MAKDIVAGILAMRKKPGAGAEMPPPGDDMEHDESPDDGMEACGEEMLAAIESKDARALAEAVKHLFTMADAMPHQEGEHE